MAAILDAIMGFLEVPGGFFRTFSMLLCPYFRGFNENFSLLGAISSIQLMVLLNDSHFGRHLGFLGSLRGIPQDF